MYKSLEEKRFYYAYNYICRKVIMGMKFNFWLAAVGFCAVISCKSPLALNHVQTEKNISIRDTIADDAAAAAVIEPYKKSMEAQMYAKISHTATELTKTGDNSNLGNLLADYTYQGADTWAKQNNLPGVDGAVINIGGIRSTIGAGDIQLRHVYEVMPFENEVVIVKLSGAALQGLFDYYLKSQKNNPVSHLVIETADGKLVRSLVNGQTVDPAKTYYIATSDYLAQGGDNMKYFANGETINTGLKLRDLFVEKFKANPEVKTSTDERLIFKRQDKH